LHSSSLSITTRKIQLQIDGSASAFDRLAVRPRRLLCAAEKVIESFSNQNRQKVKFFRGIIKMRHCSLFGILLFNIILCRSYVSPAGFGRCPKYPSMPKYNMTKFLGTWYEVERSFYLPELASGCTMLSFEEESTKENDALPSRLEVAVKSINQWTGSPSINLGYAHPETRTSSIMDFKFSSRLPDVISRFLPGAGRYQILYTDYNNFAILWSCSSIANLGYTDQIWLMSRERKDFLLEVRTIIHDALTKLGLDPERLVLSKNRNCPKTL